MGLNYPLPVNQFNSLGYFYAGTSGELGSFSKGAQDQTLASIDYSAVKAIDVSLASYSFTVNVGSAPPLLISSPGTSGSILSFILSSGVVGASYILNINMVFGNGVTRTDTLEIDVPSDGCSCGSLVSIPSVINNGDPLTGNGAIYINSGIRYFVAYTQPQNPNLMDQWWNLTNSTLNEYITNGLTFFWKSLSVVTPSPLSATLEMEQLTIATLNTFPLLTYAPIVGGFIVVTVNGRPFMPLGSSPPFSVSGKQITWLSTIYSVVPASEVNVTYEYGP